MSINQNYRTARLCSVSPKFDFWTPWKPRYLIVMQAVSGAWGFGLVNTGFVNFVTSSEYPKNFFVTMLRISLCLGIDCAHAEPLLSYRWVVW